MNADAPADVTADTAPFVVVAFYKFIPLPDVAALQESLLATCRDAGISGTILLASEGINGTIAGNREGIDRVLACIGRMLGGEPPAHKESYALENPFYRMKVRLKKEIVTMGVTDIDPNQIVGTYVEPEDWNALITDPDVIVIDTRNDYEVAIGSFQGAVDPTTATFRDFPGWFRAQPELRPDALQGKKIAMFCTGGIRCEKATAFVKKQGIDDVFHLKGGILKYLETVPEADSLWQGECFVFDQRVAVQHELKLGTHELCRACRRPISVADKASPKFVEGVSCASCFDTNDADRKRRFLERQRQMDLAARRGESHIGQVYAVPVPDSVKDDD